MNSVKGRTGTRAVLLVRILVVMLLATLALAPPAGGQPVSFIVVWFLGFNTTQPPFNDVLARRAVATALDRAQLARADDNTLATGVEAPGCLGHNPGARMHPFNPQQARELLAQSGFKADDYSELGVWMLSSLGRIQTSKRETEILIDNLRAIGMPATVRQFGNYDALRRIAILPVVKMSYWGILTNTAICSQETLVEDLVHSRGVFNYFGYRNPEVDALIERALGARDRQTAAQLYREVEQKILDDVVIVPVWWFVFR